MYLLTEIGACHVWYAFLEKCTLRKCCKPLKTRFMFYVSCVKQLLAWVEQHPFSR